MFYLKEHGIFFLSQMKLPGQHKEGQLFQLIYELITIYPC